MSKDLSPMQEQLLGQASNILTALSNSVEKATDFTVNAATKAGEIAAQQIPDIALQYVAYGRASATVIELFGVITMAVGLWLIIFVACLNKFKMADRYGWADGRIAAVFSGVLLTIIGLTSTLGNLSEFLMVWIAPKVWLMREIVHLVK